MNSSPPRLQLKPLQISGFPELIEIPAEGLTLGRSASCSIVFGGKNFPSVSGEHTRIRQENDRYTIEDLNSKNGTLVNGQKVTEHVLEKGDMIQLGMKGPTLVVVDPLEQTATVSFKVPPAPGNVDLGATTIRRLKRAIGVPENVEGGVDGLLQRRNRRVKIGFFAVALLGAAAIVGAFFFLQSQFTKELSAKDEELAALRNAMASERVRHQEAIDREKQRLEEKTQMLEKQLSLKQNQLEARLDDDQVAAQAEIEQLQNQLTETREQLDKFNPINLEREGLARRQKLIDIRRAVVFLDVEVQFRDVKTGQVLRIHEKDDGTTEAGITDKGTPVSSESAGSGFCVHPDGWIISNAHVVHPSEDDRIEFGDLAFEPILANLQAVFTDSSRRHKAEVVRVARTGDQDLALLKIEPFDGMPYIEGLDVSRELPPPGSPIYLFGFPLGDHALQERDIMKASTFSGIVSRQVGQFFQVDAAIYPGNSGGPVIDEQGNIIGVASATQTLPSGDSLANSMGYAIPVSSLIQVWPPPKEL